MEEKRDLFFQIDKESLMLYALMEKDDGPVIIGEMKIPEEKFKGSFFDYHMSSGSYSGEKIVISFQNKDKSHDVLLEMDASSPLKKIDGLSETIRLTIDEPISLDENVQESDMSTKDFLISLQSFMHDPIGNKEKLDEDLERLEEKTEILIPIAASVRSVYNLVKNYKEQKELVLSKGVFDESDRAVFNNALQILEEKYPNLQKYVERERYLVSLLPTVKNYEPQEDRREKYLKDLREALDGSGSIVEKVKAVQGFYFEAVEKGFITPAITDDTRSALDDLAIAEKVLRIADGLSEKTDLKESDKKRIFSLFITEEDLRITSKLCKNDPSCMGVVDFYSTEKIDPVLPKESEPEKIPIDHRDKVREFLKTCTLDQKNNLQSKIIDQINSGPISFEEAGKMIEALTAEMEKVSMLSKMKELKSEYRTKMGQVEETYNEISSDPKYSKVQNLLNGKILIRLGWMKENITNTKATVELYEKAIEELSGYLIDMDHLMEKAKEIQKEEETDSGSPKIPIETISTNAVTKVVPEEDKLQEMLENKPSNTNETVVEAPVEKEPEWKAPGVNIKEKTSELNNLFQSLKLKRKDPETSSIERVAIEALLKDLASIKFSSVADIESGIEKIKKANVL